MNKIEAAFRVVSPENIDLLQRKLENLQKQVGSVRAIEQALYHLQEWFGDAPLQSMARMSDADLLGIMEGLQQPTFSEFGSEKWRARMALEYLMNRAPTSYEGSTI
jgi:hypothetical protein